MHRTQYVRETCSVQDPQTHACACRFRPEFRGGATSGPPKIMISEPYLMGDGQSQLDYFGRGARSYVQRSAECRLYPHVLFPTWASRFNTM